MNGSTELACELDYFVRHKAEYLQAFPGLYVLIKGEHMLGPFPSAEVAHSVGLNTFGMTPFLIKQVLEREPAGYLPFFSRAREPDAGL